LSEFKEWILKQIPNFETLKGLSIGRIDHDKNYSLSNIEIQTLVDNAKERISRCGNPMNLKEYEITILDFKTRKVIGLAKSTRDAAKLTGCTKSSIHVRTLINSNKYKPKNPTYNNKFDFIYTVDHK
jgi:hypothetical protein